MIIRRSPHDPSVFFIISQDFLNFHRRHSHARKTRKNQCHASARPQKAAYTVYSYDGGALSGTEVASALGKDPERCFKTLVTVGKTGGHYVFMIPVAAELDLRKAASAAGEKSVAMLPQKELLPLTGYIHGGCSPIGMKKQFPTFADATIADGETVCFSGGRVGLQIETTLAVLQSVVPVTLADLTV
ncbi:aminoacyl-tRNA deacylase [Faecousia sp.]|uniref:aminoacyl-tRNA deacylase n=1 Tax=Faecousia sp. TaxID=2952921 RepID=UPI003A8CD18F